MAELHAFRFEQRSLKIDRLRRRARADLTLRVDHPMPGYVIVGAERRKSPTDLSGCAGHSGQRRHLPIGRHETLRNAFNGHIHPIPAFCRFGHLALRVTLKTLQSEVAEMIGFVDSF